MKTLRLLSVLTLLIFYAVLSTGCTALSSFPMTARAGDTIVLGLGFDAINQRELMDVSNTTITIADNTMIDPDLTYTANVTARSVLSLYPDPRSFLSNFYGELPNLPLDGDPFETMIVLDLPTDIPPGAYFVEIASPYVVTRDFWLEVIDDTSSGPGSSDPFLDGNTWSSRGTELYLLERLPVTTVSFDPAVTVGAVELVLDFDQSAVSPSDINIYQPRKVFGSGTFQNYQRMMEWSDDGDTITVNILCPYGVSSEDLEFEVIYQAGPDPNLAILSAKVYDLDGNEITGVTASLN